MKKLTQLLDDVTIINFGLLVKLAKRYTLHLLFAFGLFFFLFFKNYYSQPIIFSANLPLKVLTKQSSLPFDLDIRGRGDAAPPTVNIGELTATFGSFAFNKTFAEFVVQDKDFLEMNFGSIATGKGLSGRDISKTCNEQNDCIITTVAGILNTFFTIDQGLTEDRYNITVNSLEKNTTLRLADSLMRAIEKNRVQVRRYVVSKEIESVNNLITESRSYLKKQNALQRLEEEDKKAQQIADIKERMRIIQASLSNEIANTSALEARLTENKKIVENISVNTDALTKVKSREMEKKITDIRHNIAAITNIREEQKTESDKLILAQLKLELEVLEAKQFNGESIRTIALKDTFSDDQRTKENDIRFEYLVSKNKVANLKAEYETIKNELNEAQKDKTSREAIASKMKSELEFLKNLESKELSLKIMSSTETSDLHFEDFNNDTLNFRRSSSLKIWLFSFCFTLVVYIFSLVIRFAIDDRIYTEYDLAPYLHDLKFVGEVAIFD